MKNFFSLWLVPTGDAFGLMQSEVAIVSGAVGAKPFTPHVTLLGAIEGAEEDVARKAREFVGGLTAFRLVLGDRCISPTKYKAIFRACSRAHDLMRANRNAAALFRTSPAEYHPHLSLLYADLSMNRKGDVLAGCFHAEACPTSFTVRSAHLYRTPDNDPLQAELIEEIPLSE